MIFEFLKYLQPTSYFLLKRNNGLYVFPDVATIPEHIKNQLEFDERYDSVEASNRDMSWQALNKGYISKEGLSNFDETISIRDNYHFIRKYFNRAWVYYVLLLRLMSLKNPVREVRAFYTSRATKRSSYLEQPIDYENYGEFNSSLATQSPLICVVIPTLNRYTYLKDVLKDLEHQSYKNFEVIVIDQSEPFERDFYDVFNLNITIEYQKEKALWLARNTAIKMSSANYFLLFDDDSRVDEDWIVNHLKGLEYFNADISSGVSISKVGAETPRHYAFFRISDQLDTGNVLVSRHVFESIGLFDRQFEKQRMGDGEFGLRAYLNNYLNVSNPYAKRLHLKVGSGGLRDMGSWDAFRTKKLMAPRPIPSVLYLFRNYFGNKQSKLALFKTVPISIMPYRFKKNKLMMVLGIFVSLLLLPIVIFQVQKSWKLSGRKLNEGPKIERLV